MKIVILNAMECVLIFVGSAVLTSVIFFHGLPTINWNSMDKEKARNLATAFVLEANALAAKQAPSPQGTPSSLGVEWDTAENKQVLIITKTVNAHALFKFPGTTEEDWWFVSNPSVLLARENGDLVPMYNGRSAVCAQPSARETKPRQCWRVEVRLNKK